MKTYRYTRGAPLPREFQADFIEHEKGLATFKRIPVRYGDYIVQTGTETRVMNNREYRDHIK